MKQPTRLKPWGRSYYDACMACREEKSQCVYFVSADEVVLKQPFPADIAEYHRLQYLENDTQISIMRGTNQELFSTLESECEATSEFTDIIKAVAGSTPICYCDLGLALSNGSPFTCHTCKSPRLAKHFTQDFETGEDHIIFKDGELEISETLVMDFEGMTAQLPQLLL